MTPSLASSRKWPCLLLLALVVLAASTVTDYGYSWDEQVRATQGEQKLEYYQAILSGDRDRVRQLGQRADRYPGFFDLNLALLRRISPMNDVDTGHVFAAVFGVLGTVGVWKIGGLIGGIPVAFAGAAFLALFPAWYGHMFINPKDIPFATGYIWSLFCFSLWIRNYPKITLKLVTATGLIVGATMAVRVGGAVLYCYMGLFALLALGAIALKEKPEPGAFLKMIAAPLGMKCAASFAISATVLLAYWPAAHRNPFSHATESLAAVTNFAWELPVLFQGSYMPAPELPATFVHQILLLTSPFGILLAWFAGAVFAVSWLANKWKDYREHGGASLTRENVILVLLAFSVLFPLYYIVLRNSTLYNGIRHMMFVLPPAAVLAGYAAVRLHRYVCERGSAERRADVADEDSPVLAGGPTGGNPSIKDDSSETNPVVTGGPATGNSGAAEGTETADPGKSAGALAFRFVIPAVFIVLYLPVVSAMIRLHPYQYVYYNALAGGFPNAVERYETEYWVTAYRETADEFVAYLDSLPDEETSGRRFIVNMEHPTYLFSVFLPDDRPYDLQVVRSQGEPADFYVAAISWEAHRYYYGEIVATVERMGVPLAYIKDRRHLRPEQRVMHYDPEER